MSGPMPLVRGTLDIVVLNTLTRGPMHGFEIVSWLEQRSGGRLEIEDSALYQALRRLERRGCLRAAWCVTANNRRARYYHLTARGRAHLRAETERWRQYAETLASLLTLAPRG